MTDATTETPPTKPKPARKARKAAAKPRAAAPANSELDGITVSDCPIACVEKRCVISGVGQCAHPHKGGLQAALQNPASMRRFNESKRMLGKQKIDLR